MGGTMESWSDIQREIAEAGKEKNLPGDPDKVRREAYQRLAALTGRPLIVYASAFHVPVKAQLVGSMLSLDLADKDGFQEVVRNLDGDSVDVFVHSPGGSAEATESVVAILRSKFNDIRFIVTGSAKSAATMLVMSGNTILMTDAAELGPTDPQEFVGRPRPSPAGAILDQFTRGKKEVSKAPSLIGPWLPILQQYGPSLLVECQNHIKLSETLVAGWLHQYMFGGALKSKAKAKRLARYLANDKNFLSHSRRVDLAGLRSHGAIVCRVEDLPLDLQTAINRVHLTIMATFDMTAAIKIFENSAGAVLIRMMQAQVNVVQQQ
jgi:hypothetical protein